MSSSDTNASLFAAALVETSIPDYLQQAYKSSQVDRLSGQKSHDQIAKTLNHVTRPARCVGVVWTLDAF